jgi:hypothetical protein
LRTINQPKSITCLKCKVTFKYIFFNFLKWYYLLRELETIQKQGNILDLGSNSILKRGQCSSRSNDGSHNTQKLWYEYLEFDFKPGAWTCPILRTC